MFMDRKAFMLYVIVSVVSNSCFGADDDIFQDKEEFTAPIPVPIPCEYIIGTCIQFSPK